MRRWPSNIVAGIATGIDSEDAAIVKIVCDELDEIVATMLAQVQERAGYQAQVIVAAGTDDILAEASHSKPDIVCLSALSPFVISRARLLYAKLHEQLPQALIIVGLWTFSGDRKLASRRVGIQGKDSLLMRLSQVVSFINAAHLKLPVNVSETTPAPASL